MAETSPRRMAPWVAFLAGVLVAVLLALAWSAWNRSRGAAEGVRFAVPIPQAPELPITPTIPDAPRIPDAPLPTPR